MREWSHGHGHVVIAMLCRWTLPAASVRTCFLKVLRNLASSDPPTVIATPGLPTTRRDIGKEAVVLTSRCVVLLSLDSV